MNYVISFVTRVEAIDWAAVDRALDWMTTYARCAGCRSGGGEWLRDYGQQVNDSLMKSQGLSREEYVRKMRSTT